MKPAALRDRLAVMHRPVVAALGILVVALAVACETAPAVSPTPEVQLVLIRTQPPAPPNQACMGALLTGRLVLTPLSGIGVDGGGETVAVAWPFGYSAISQAGVTVLLDHTRQPLARVGDQIQMGGGHGGDGFWYPCHGDLEVID